MHVFQQRVRSARYPNEYSGRSSPAPVEVYWGGGGGNRLEMKVKSSPTEGTSSWPVSVVY